VIDSTVYWKLSVWSFT